MDAQPEIIRVPSWDEFATAWRTAGLRGHKNLHRTTTRVARLQMRITSDYWRENWQRAIEHAGRCRRFREGSGEFPGITVDTFLKDEDMVVRILEGEFDDIPDRNPGPRKAQPYTLPFQEPTEAERRAALDILKRGKK